MRADTAAIFVGLHDVVGADRNQPAITNLHLAVKLDKSLSLPTILRAEAAAAQYDDHRILSLQLGELPAFRRVVGIAHSRGRQPLEPCRIACEVLRGLPHVGDQGASRHKSMTTSPSGCEQQINTLPSAGMSIGSGRYLTVPATRLVSHVWQTPVRQDHRVGTSHASASSSRHWNVAPQGTFKPVRVNETTGPPPIGPLGRWGGRRGDAATPGVMGGWEPKISV